MIKTHPLESRNMQSKAHFSVTCSCKTSHSGQKDTQTDGLRSPLQDTASCSAGVMNCHGSTGSERSIRLDVFGELEEKHSMKWVWSVIDSVVRRSLHSAGEDVFSFTHKRLKTWWTEGVRGNNGRPRALTHQGALKGAHKITPSLTFYFILFLTINEKPFFLCLSGLVALWRSHSVVCLVPLEGAPDLRFALLFWWTEISII